MSQDTLLARQYLAPSAHTFWEWRDEGSVITWRDGTTIAFRSEIEQVLARLAPQGLPPFDAIVLILTACRPTWRGGEQELAARNIPGITADSLREETMRDVVATLDRIAGLPSEIHIVPNWKSKIAARVFASAKPILNAGDAVAILREIPRLPCEVYAEPRTDVDFNLQWRLSPIAKGKDNVDATRLLLREKTGLDALPKPAEVEVPPPVESLAVLLRRLEADNELGGMVRLARQVRAALTLPQSVSEQEPLPLGGVSDISNRGSFDRLLVSELAHDDLTFTVRIALNEALYLRREAPPSTPPKQRLILIDSGLRMWGVPRVFATAAALALAANTPSRDAAAVYRARGGHLDVVDFSSRDGLVAHLAALESSVHPGEAVPTFCRLASEGTAVAEPVLITGEDVLEDKNFKQKLAEIDLPVLYVVSVERG